MEFIYTLNPEDEYPIMLINQHIGTDEKDGPGVLENQFCRELVYLDAIGKKKIQIWINSEGGSVKEGWGIYSTILRVSAKVDTYCIGMAASIAGVIFQAGAKRVMMEHSRLMLHNPFNPNSEGSNKTLAAIRESIIEMICSRCKMTETEVGNLMNRTTWIDSEEAVKMGLATEIEKNQEFNKLRANASSREVLEVVNKIVNQSKPHKMSDLSQITDRLDLSEGTKESVILNAIDKLKNENAKAKEAFSTIEDLKTTINKQAKDLEEYDKLKAMFDEKEKAYNAQGEELNSLKEKLIKIEKERADRDKIEAENKADALVTAYVNSGAIKKDAEDILKWKNKAIADYTGTEDLLKSIPTTVKAVVVTAAQNKADEKKDGVVDPNKEACSASSFQAKLIVAQRKGN